MGKVVESSLGREQNPTVAGLNTEPLHLCLDVVTTRWQSSLACSGEDPGPGLDGGARGVGQPCPLLQASFDPRAWREEGLRLQRFPLLSPAGAALLRPLVTLMASVSVLLGAGPSPAFLSSPRPLP